MEKKNTGLCSESMFSSSRVCFALSCFCFSTGLLLKIGFGLIAKKILNSHTFQTYLDSMASGLIKYKKSVFSIFIGYSVMINTFK